ncbi:2-dehydro-3-deoxygalactonokinase [Hydrogenophaga sp. 5NK40-0174]|uniref:2-dehydro-3-deoxygalactonokinase n=1 Tax=Hydrogenophaga sp. 5NK40-0174 TaxID=3127649 RepID=UPI0031036D41
METARASGDATGLIGIDWGTSSVRAFRMGRQAELLDQRHSKHGIMHLPQGGCPPGRMPRATAFEQAFQELCGDWIQESPGAPVIASGMIGSAQGWRQAPYLRVPCDPKSLARTLTTIDRGPGNTPIHVIGGLEQTTPRANVMRGEETQVLGVLRRFAHTERLPLGPLLIGLPGTHSKWVWVSEEGCITRFETVMTGEVFGLLCRHSLLGQTMTPREDATSHMGAFRQGLSTARDEGARLGVLSDIFTTRAMSLSGRLAPNEQADYLSGVLIGHEVVALVRQLKQDMQDMQPPPVVLCGDSRLCERYRTALIDQGVMPAAEFTDACAEGLWSIADQAALLAPSQVPPTASS